MKYTYVFILSILAISTMTSQEDFTQFVNPFIGTSKMGHVYPGATSPFGMVQVSPQTNFEPLHLDDGNYNKKTYEYCAGYQYKDSTILGFTHTNFSGTGHSDLGDILILPTQGELNLEQQFYDKKNGNYEIFSHDKEIAKPGYYSVELDKNKIKAELTASDRVGFHRYTFSKTKEAHIILDLVYNVYHHDNKNVWTFLRVENDNLITGYRQTKGWARTRKVFFAIKFSKPMKSYGHKKYDEILYDGFYRHFNQEKNFPEMAGKDLRAYFDFDIEKDEELLIKVSLSSVSTEGALTNMEAEMSGWDFDQVYEETKRKWNAELSKIQIEPIKSEDMITFYTALYHSTLSPIIYEDVDGRYRGLDQNVHQSDGFTNYTIFSLWDTYRALHPLFNLIQADRNVDMIKSMLAHQEQSVHNMLPIWSHYANENWCMIGYHAVSVIADAIVKGNVNFDIEQALNASIQTAHVLYFEGLGEYMKYKYVPDDLSHSSVSKTLEYSYDDWCISQIAQKVGDKEMNSEFLDRSNYYKNVFDVESGYMRPRLSDGTFRKDFDPQDTHGQGFIEGNAWNYGLYVPQDIESMVDMMGGKRKFADHLDMIFTTEIEDRFIDKNEDITRDGIIGNYVHGNEPGHHIPYLYNWTDSPFKTQERVRMIMRTMYDNTIYGLCGNDDCGQMSAWYIFSALGFYPVCPGSPYYAIGSPMVKNATIKLSNGNELTIKTKNQSESHVYVSKVVLNDIEVENYLINHHDLAKGGELEFIMSEVPSR